MDEVKVTYNGDSNTSSTDAVYFESYADVAVHQIMIADRPRTETYARALSDTDWCRNKIVMDVGCGSGILSLLAARGGAAHVFAVEASTMAAMTARIVADNDLSDKISVVHSKVENINILELRQILSDKGIQSEFQEGCGVVDVIVSEWMGFALLQESMLDSVLIARDLFLRRSSAGGRFSGMMLPAHAELVCAPVQLDGLVDQSVSFWYDLEKTFDFDLSALAPVARARLAMQPEIRILDESSAWRCLSPPQLVASFDLLSLEISQLKLIQNQLHFKLSPGPTNCKSYTFYDELLHGFAFWFETKFNPPSDINPVISLSTSPFAEPTHWKQTIVSLPKTLKLRPRNNEDCSVVCWIRFSQCDDNARQYEIEVEVPTDGYMNLRHESDDEEVEDAIEESSTEHPVPCPCSSMKCILIRHTLNQYK